MRGRLVRRGAATMAALAVGVVGAMGVVPTVASADPVEATPLSVPGMAVSLAQAGEVRLWGSNEHGQMTIPASLSDVAVSQVLRPQRATLVLTAGGEVVGWGANEERLERVPAEVSAVKVAQIATQGGYAGAVTRDGRVLTWGKKRSTPNPLNVPAGLSGVKQLALSEYSAAALKSDGSVVAWGYNAQGQTNVPPALASGAVKATVIAATGAGAFMVLTEQGTVVAWGMPPSLGLPAVLQEPGNVKAIATANSGGVLALLTDNTLVLFDTARDLPAEFATADPVLLASGIGTGELAIVDRDRVIHYSDGGVGATSEIPADMNHPDLVQIVLGNLTDELSFVPVGAVIITKFLRADLPQVTGAAQVGSVLSGVPGTFSAVPDSVTSQWLVNGAPAGSSAQLTVTEAMVGQTISYQSTASKGAETRTSASAAVTVTKPAPPPPVVVAKVASSTKVAKVSVAKKAASVVVSGKVTASKSPAGKAKVTIKMGKKVIVTKAVAVSAAGALKLTVKKFSKLVAKKVKAKGKKAKTAYRGKYQVTIAYGGNTLVNPSAGSGKFTIKK